MPKVRDSSGTIGTTWRPIALSRNRVVRIRTKAIVVEISRSAGRLELGRERRQLRHRQRPRTSAGAPAAARPAPPAAPAGICSSGPPARQLQERHLGDLVVGQVDAEPVAERAQHVLAHLLLLVGDVLALAGLAHAVALDRLGQDHRRASRRCPPRPCRRRRPWPGRARPGDSAQTSSSVMSATRSSSSGYLPKKCSRT